MKDPRVDDLIWQMKKLELKQASNANDLNIKFVREDIREINHKLDAILAHLGMDIEYVSPHFELVPKKEA